MEDEIKDIIKEFKKDKKAYNEWKKLDIEKQIVYLYNWVESKK